MFHWIKNMNLLWIYSKSRKFDTWLKLNQRFSLFFFAQGEYFFELDDKSVLPGYPKLIEDVWGIPGPIDAAFTRFNCQGQSYIFKVEALVFIKNYRRIFLGCLTVCKTKNEYRCQVKCDVYAIRTSCGYHSCLFFVLQGNKYWRFNNDILDGDYPRDISVGFDGIPNDVNAAFALPTSSHIGKERAYFFKGTLGAMQFLCGIEMFF